LRRIKGNPCASTPQNSYDTLTHLRKELIAQASYKK